MFREKKNDVCDFLETEQIVYENETDFLKRIQNSKNFLIEFIKKNPNIHKIGIIGHSDFFWYFSSEIIENERFGNWLKNGESISIRSI